MEFQGQLLRDNSLSEVSMIILNDDCFIHLFDYLNFFDSFALAQTCKRLDFIFRAYIVQKKLLHFDELRANCKHWLGAFEFIAATYGAKLKRLHINSGTMEQQIFNIIHNYPLKNLQTLTMEKMRMETT